MAKKKSKTKATKRRPAAKANGRKSAKKKTTTKKKAAAKKKPVSRKKAVSKKKTSTKKTASRKTASRKPSSTTTKKRATKPVPAPGRASPKARRPSAGNDTKPAAAAPAKRRTSRLPARQLRRIRELLREKKIALTDHLRTELSVLERPEKRHRADLEEMASDTHDTDSVCEIMDIESSQIDQIESALHKIDEGTYGICEDCGGDIASARLEALPFATQCIECKRKSELSGEYSFPA